MGAVLPVVVVHYRAPAWCRSAVEAIRASAGVEVDVVVVDNSGELAADPPAGATVVASPGNAGYAGGANLGLRHALERHPGVPLVAVCSHDFHPEPSCFGLLVAAAGAEPALGVLAPRLTAPKASIGATFDGRGARNIAPHPEAPPVFDADWVSGTCMVLRADALAAVGGFDEGFGSYVEDIDMCLRVREAGWRVATVVAAAGRGLGSVSEARHRMAAVNVALLAAKREGGSAAWALTASYLGRAAVSGLLAVAPSRRDAARRRRSLRFARSRLGAVADLVRSRRIGAYARDPHRFEPRLPAMEVR